MKTLKSITILKNIKYLLTKSLSDEKEHYEEKMLIAVDQYYRYSLLNEKIIVKRPHIYDYRDSIKLLLTTPKSFCRFGDGELEIMMGNSIPFQRYDFRLAQYLFEIIKYPISNFYVGLPYDYFHSIDTLNKFSRKFIMLNGVKYREFILQYCDMERYYLDTGFTQKYINSDRINLEKHFDDVKMLFWDKDIVLFVGKDVLKKIQYNIFENVRSMKFVEVAAKNAFSDFDDILQYASSFPKKYTLCFILGPTAKPLIYELTKLKYTAWDIGHLVKDYNAFMTNIDKTPDNVEKFFQPD
jgi:glycosyltransferase family protein